MFEDLITIYKDDDIQIKHSNLYGMVIYFDNRIRIDTRLKQPTNEQCEYIAPLLKVVCTRMYKVGYSDGYDEGREEGVLELQNNIKRLLGVIYD